MKRGVEELADFSCLDHATQSAKVQGVVTALSPMKKARTGECQYFNGSLSDGKARVRLYGHNAGAHKKLSKFFETANSVLLNNCQVKPTRAGDGYEVFVKDYTEVQKSPSKFTVWLLYSVKQII